MDNVRVSVVMASFNGEKYIEEQIQTILECLDNNDELIISDDGSIDNTRNIIKDFSDKRIILIDGPRKGIKKNFENAIKYAKGKYIFLSDQDDVWKNDKVKKVIEVFEEEKCLCVVHDCEVFNSANGEVIYDSFFKFRNSGKGIIKNIYKNTYIGCCMAFSSEIIDYILPIPSEIEMHDQWIGIIAEECGKVKFIDEKLIKYRRHELNVSQMKHYPLKKMIKNRVILVTKLMSFKRKR